MTREAKKFLFDITTAIDHIFSVYLGDLESKEDFVENLTVQRAVERELGIIGEACTKLRKIDVELSGTDSMINRRNTIVHQYDACKPQNIWDMVYQDLPSLQSEVDELLK